MNSYKLVFSLLILIIFGLSCEKEMPKPTPEPEPEPIIKEAKPHFSISDMEVKEGVDTIVEIKVVLTGKHSKAIQIQFNTVSGTAEPSSDYTAIDSLLTFSGTDTIQTKSIFIKILDDEVFEITESFELAFDIDTTVIVDKKNLKITIVDNDYEFTDNDFPGYVTARNKDGFNLIWSDEFGGEEVNSEDWIQSDKGNWYNNELQYYSPNNSAVADGLLTITAKKENKSGHNYTASRLWSQHKVHFKYGRIDIRAKLPYSKGLWPAFWMMGENRDVVSWPQCGEIDIMELRGHIPNEISSTIHFKNSAGKHQFPAAKKYKLSNGDFSKEFHVFSMYWNPYRIEFYVDDQRYNTIFHNNFSHFNDDNPFNNEFYILMNVAVGGDFGGNPNSTTVWPQTMDVDYVRVYEEL